VTKTQIPQPLGSNAADGRWTGWVVFASIMLAVVGGINIIQGLAALFNDSVEKLGDELCGGLKVSSNVEIARSP
jgi:hypothetical protein